MSSLTMCWIRANRFRVALALAFASAGIAGTAAADPPSKDAAMAETLFADARKRMASGDYEGACPKLSESYRLDPGGGTLTALALCHEQTGKTATAWAEFHEVMAEAQQGGRADREKYARQHIAALEPSLSRLTINVAAETAQIPEVAVHRDKVAVGSAAWGVASPVDPGEHVVEAVAPGKVAWSTHVVVNGNGDTKSVDIPPLGDQAPATEGAEPAEKAPPLGQLAPDTNPPEPEAAPPAHRGSPQRTTGLVIGAAGLASIAVGSYFGVEALSNSNDAKKVCSPSNCTNSNAVHTNEDAKTDAAVTDVLVGAGLAAVLAGALVFLSAPARADAPAVSPDANTTRLRDLRLLPAVGLRGGGMILRAAW
jgi:hypothetical protein